MLINAKGVDTYGYQETRWMNQKFAQNAKAPTGTLREKQSENLNKEKKERKRRVERCMPEIKKIPMRHIFIPKDNPRREFDKEALKELAESIKTHGLLQPIMVRPKDGNYELIMGERRLRACKMLGWTEIDARVETVDDSTSLEIRLIENTQRADLTDAEKGDAVYTLMERFPDKYPTTQHLAQAIRKPIGTVIAWTRKSERLAESVREFVGAHKLTEKSANYLLKYDHDTQFKLANIAANYPLKERQAIKFFNLYDANPHANLNKLADEARGLERVEVDLSKLSKVGRKEVESYLEKREKEAIKKQIETRKRTIKESKAIHGKTRTKVWKSADETLRPKVTKLTEKLSEFEPEERQEIAEAIGRRLDTFTKSIDKETLEWMKKWETEIAPKIKQETPERYARRLEDILYGIWTQIWVEYPQGVKEVGQKQLVNSLSLERLERLQNTIKTTIRELDEFENTIESEVLARGHKRV